MAYIDKETTAKIRKALKIEFPNIKFSVRKITDNSLNVNIMKSDVFDNGEYLQVSHFNFYYIDDLKEDQKEVLRKVNDIIKSVSDYYYDSACPIHYYFGCAFIHYIAVGTPEKRHQKV